MILLRKFQIFLSYRGRKVPSCSTFLFSIHFIAKSLPFFYCIYKHLTVANQFYHCSFQDCTFLQNNVLNSSLLVLNHFLRHIFRDATNTFQGFEIFSGLLQRHSNALKHIQGCCKYIPMLSNIFRVATNAFFVSRSAQSVFALLKKR